MATPQRVLEIARGEIGYSRYTDPQNGSKYGRWYAQLTGDSYYGANGVPYCAMFVTWVFHHAGQAAPGLPGAYCPWIVNAGKKAGQTVPVRNAKMGDIVLFDWGGDGVSDHVGIVEANNGSYLTCIEGNTSNTNNSNGGTVARRTRAYSTVICIIRPNYNGDDDDMTPQDLLNYPLTSAHDGQTYPFSAFIVGTNDAAWQAANEIKRTDDPTGRGNNSTTHEHIKWIAKAISDMNTTLNSINDNLNTINSGIQELLKK